MDKQQDELALISSDECPNSGEDSDEDVITDYLCSELTDSSPISVVNGELGELIIDGNIVHNADYTKDNNAMSEGVGEPSNRNLPLLSLNMKDQQIPIVPTISVTSHSPGPSQYYPVLEDNLLQLHEIHNSIQRMRDSTLANIRFDQSDHLQRLSSSCPSLNPQNLMIAKIKLNNREPGSDVDLAESSPNSSSTHLPVTDTQDSQDTLETDRRRSWTDLEESRHNRLRCAAPTHSQAQSLRQRSISLSSLDSEMELDLDGKPRSPCTSVTNRSCRSQTSTHSLNEADFVEIDLQEVAAKRGSQRLAETANLLPCVPGSRLPLQKSISTPSIVTPAEQNLTESEAQNAPSTTRGHERNEKGSGSETETEDLHANHGLAYHGDLIREGSVIVQTSLDELMTDGVVYDDSHSEKTRRKRGSLFFRKRKDKSGKKTSQQAHHWVTATAGSQGNFVCDYCMKQFGNKSVSHCENCGTTVHQNQSCRDQMPSECTKSKSSSNKGATKSISSVSIASGSGHVKRGSTASLPPQSSIGSNREISNKKTVTSYSPWRRVATKLGVNQTISEERDGDGNGQRDIISGTEEIDFVDDVHLISVDDIEGLDPELGLKWEEPDSWSASIGRSDALRLVDNNEKEVKRQEHIYEFVLTEKHHCLVLLAMEKIFAEGLRRNFRLGPPDIERMFPRLRDLIEIHLRFLLQLRKRQNASTVVPTIADILVDQFSSINAARMKSAYGEFCSRHRDAVDCYKCFLSNDPKFAKFVRLCQTNPLLKKKGIPECILFVTQRLTKYPLLVEPLIKTGTSNEEKENLRKALKLVKEILSEVDACVADKQREDRKIEIFSRIDAKSFAMHRGEKFKKSNILSSSRVLKFEGTANLMQGRGKPTPVVVVVFSDVLLFLAETRDQKYAFFVPDNKAGVVSLQKLLVREKAGQESRGIYLISSNPSEPEMFELKVLKPKDKQVWIQSIRSAVEACPQEFENDGNDDENSIGFSGDLTGSRSGYSSVSTTSTLTLDERQKIAREKESHILGLVGELRKKDTEQALLLEEKMALQMRLLYAASVCRENETEAEKTERIEKSEQSSREIPDYTRWTRNEGTDSAQLWQEVVVAVQEATRLASSLSFSAHCGGSLSRSLSSAGEKHSEDYVPLALAVPRRAETFAGFDHNKERYPWRDSAAISSVVPPPKASDLLLRERSDRDERDDDGTEINKDQQLAAIRLSHYVYTLLCIITNQMTTIDSLQAQLATCRDFSSGGNFGGPISKSSSQNRPNPNRQLEELRNLQDQLSREKSAFRIASEQERMRLLEEKNEIARKREQLAAEQSDVKHQRDQLYRRLEALERQGVSLVAPSTAHPSSVTHSNQVLDSTLPSRKSLPDAKRIPLNLISATNQQKAPSNLPPVKQQLPLKLASGSNNNSTRSSSSSGINNSPDRHERHSRTGSSPAAVTTSAYSSPELGNSHNNGNSSHGSNRSLRITRSPPESYHQHHHHHHQLPQTQSTMPPQAPQTTIHQQSRSEPQQPLEEEVIFF